MVRSSDARINKYGAKIVGDVVKNRVDAQKTYMVDQATDRFAELTAIEEAINAKLGPWGVHSITKPFYLSYGRKLYGLKRKHSGDTLVEEACIATHAFSERGLDVYYLQLIAMDVFSIDVSSCTA
jgi:hypothetical protein